jgi:hypothetical protein
MNTCYAESMSTGTRLVISNSCLYERDIGYRHRACDQSGAVQADRESEDRRLWGETSLLSFVRPRGHDEQSAKADVSKSVKWRKDRKDRRR